MLVITPSKTDRERVIPMSADLFHVIASIIRRHTRDGRTIPLLRRFDPHDKLWSAPLPYLFQRLKGTTPAVIAAGTILLRLRIGLDQFTLNLRDAEVHGALSLFQLRRDALLNVDARFRQEFKQAACTCAFARMECGKVVRFRWVTLV